MEVEEDVQGEEWAAALAVELEDEKSELEAAERGNERLLARLARLSREVKGRDENPTLDVDSATSLRVGKMVADASKAVTAIRQDVERQLEEERESLMNNVVFSEHDTLEKAIAKTTLELRKRVNSLADELGLEKAVEKKGDAAGEIFCTSPHGPANNIVNCAYSSSLHEDILDLMNLTLGSNEVLVRLCEDHLGQVRRFRDLQITEIRWDSFYEYEVRVRRGFLTL